MKCCFLLVLISAALTVGGCDGYYLAYPGYGPYYGPAPFMVVIQDRSALPFTIDRTIEVPDIGRATRITSGSLAIGCTEMVRKSGDAVTTSYADID